MDIDNKKEKPDSRLECSKPHSKKKEPQKPHPFQKTDDDYWEEMLGLSKGPMGWYFGCG